MTTNLTAVGIAVTALSSAVVGGIFYAFSTFVMRGLDRTDPADAITAMRGINAEANASPAFLLGYFSATILALVVGVIAIVRLNQPGSWWLLIGAILAILGAIITMVSTSRSTTTSIRSTPLVCRWPMPHVNGGRISRRGRRGTTPAPSPPSSAPR
jgi:uncharacterized membrane protein